MRCPLCGSAQIAQVDGEFNRSCRHCGERFKVVTADENGNFTLPASDADREVTFGEREAFVFMGRRELAL